MSTPGETRYSIEKLSSKSQPSNPTADATCSKTKRKSMKPRSEVWKHFDKFCDDQGNSKCKCKYCGREFYCDPRNNGTSSLNNHLSRCKKSSYKEVKKQPLLNFHPHSMGHEGENMDAVADLRFDQEALGVACMSTLDQRTLNHAEREGFIDFIPLEPPERERIIPSVPDERQLYLNEKLKLKNFLKTSCQRVCLTIDRWSSLGGTKYICLSARFIDNDWKLNKRILNFCPISSDRGEAIGKTVAECLLDWGINKVFTVTVDSASSSEYVVAYLEKITLISAGTILQGKFLHGKCIGHIFNLIVVDVLKEMADPVAHVRGAVQYVLRCPSRLSKFKECCERERIRYDELCVDNAARWDSTYLMLQAAILYYRVFKDFEKCDPLYSWELLVADGKGTPTDEDWEVVKMLVEFCKFFFVMLRDSESLYVTPNPFLEFNLRARLHLLECQGKGDAQFERVVKRMLFKYCKYWYNTLDECENWTGNMDLLIYIAAVLDPRKKLERVELELSKCLATNLGEKVRMITYALYNEYENMITSQSGKKSDGMQTSSETDRTSEELRMFENGGGESTSELDAYLAEDVEEDSKVFDILGWWKSNSQRFPILSQIARDVLAVPIYSVPSGYAFSTEECALDESQSSMTPELLQAEICTQNWRQASQNLVNVNEDSEELNWPENSQSLKIFYY